MIGIEIDRAHRGRRRRDDLGQAKRGDQAAALGAAAGVGLDGEIVLVVRRSRVGREAAPVWNDICRLHRRRIQRRPDMGVIHPAGSAAARGLPLPDIDIAVCREMQSAAAHGRRRARNRLRPGVKGSVARQRGIRRGQQHRKLVFVVLMLVADPIAGVKQVPSVGFLDQRQMLQRARRVLPGEEEIRKGAVMHRANRDPGFALAVEIPAFAGQERERLDAAPGPVRRVAVEGRHVGGADALQSAGDRPRIDPSPR